MSEGDALATLCSAIKAGDVIEVNKVLSEDSVDVNGMTKDWYKSRPIILAASSGHRDIIAALLNKSSLDPNLPDGLFGNTALIDASHAGNTDVVRQLLDDKRINVSYKTERAGMTALMQAARYGHARVVEHLVKADEAGVNLQSGGGCTPLMLACLAPNQAVLTCGEMIKHMLNSPVVDLDIKDSQGKTALDWARDKELFMIEKLILGKINSNKTPELLPELQIRELEEKLRKSEEVNNSLRQNIEELTLRVKDQADKINELKSR